MASVCDERGSEERGEKWATQWLTDMLVGKANPAITFKQVRGHGPNENVVIKSFTFGNLDTLDGFVEHGPCTLLNEFISLDANIEDFGSLHTEGDKLLDCIGYNVSGCL